MPKNSKIKKSQDRYAPTVWAGAANSDGRPEFEELTVPSGQMVLVRRPGVQGLLRAGVLLSVDSLTAKVSKYVTDGRVSDEAVGQMQQDPEAIAEMTRTVDRVVQHIVVKPELAFTPDDPTNRQAGVIYLDTVDLADRVFLFNFALVGLRDVERFRRATDAAVDRVAAEQGLGDATSDLAAGLGRGGGVVPEPGGAHVRQPRRVGGGQRGKGRTQPGADAGGKAAGVRASA